MEKLTATGRDFGEGKLYAPEGFYDFVWDFVRTKMVEDPRIHEIRTFTLLNGVPHQEAFVSLKEVLKTVLPYKVCEKDLDRYTNDLVRIVGINK